MYEWIYTAIDPQIRAPVIENPWWKKTWNRRFFCLSACAFSIVFLFSPVFLSFYSASYFLKDSRTVMWLLNGERQSVSVARSRRLFWRRELQWRGQMWFTGIKFLLRPGHAQFESWQCRCRTLKARRKEAVPGREMWFMWSFFPHRIWHLSWILFRVNICFSLPLSWLIDFPGRPLVNWLIDWSTDWLIDCRWSIDWLIDCH